MAVKKDLGFVLKAFDFRESSKIAYIYTRQSGKIGGLFKGFRNHPKHFSTPLDIFSLNEFVFYPSRSNLHLVSAADIVSNYPHVRQSQETFYLASYMVELVDKIMPFHYVQEEIFDLIRIMLESLGDFSSLRLLSIFQIKILSITGFRPSLTSCIHCGKALEKQGLFSWQRGGMLCQGCFSYDRQAKEISADVIASLKYIQQKSFPQVYNLKPKNTTLRQMIRILDDFLSYHLDTRLKSKIFLEALV